MAQSFLNDFYQNPELKYLGNENIGGQARGGTYLATRPTTAVFGEAGPEIASFIPLSNLSSSFGGVDLGGNAGSPSQVGGNLKLIVDLSPDLQARIIDDSLNEVSAIINSIGRER